MTKSRYLMAIVLGSVIGEGCASPLTMMVNARTGHVVSCSASGFGLIPAIAASNRHASCLEQMQGLGYVAANSLTDEQRANLPGLTGGAGLDFNVQPAPSLTIYNR